MKNIDISYADAIGNYIWAYIFITTTVYKICL